MKFLSRLSTSVFILIGLSLVGCKEPDITVTSLSAGKALPAPVLLTNGLDNKFPDDQKFLRFTGNCHSKINGFEISYLQPMPIGLPNYQIIPTITEYDSDNDLTVDTVFANDLDCSDGNFDFILSLDIIMSQLGFANLTELENADIQALYIRGVASSERTLPLILLTDSGSGSGSGSQIPTYITIKTWNYHRVVPANKDCAEINIGLLGDSFKTLDTRKIQSGSYQIEMSTAIDGPYNVVTTFVDESSCLASTGARTTQFISTNNEGTRIFMNFNGIEGTRYFRAKNASLNYDGKAYSLISRLPRAIYRVPISEEVNSRFLLFNNVPHRIVHDRCCEIGLEYISGNISVTPSEIASELAYLTLEHATYDASGDDPLSSGFSLHKDSSCSILLNNTSVTWTERHARIYLKYTGAGSNQWAEGQLKISGTSSSGKTVYSASTMVFSEPDALATPY